MLAGEILRRASCRFPDKAAIVEGSRSLTYAAFDAAADRCALALANAGCGKGDRIAAVTATCLEFCVLYYGAARAGVVLAAISPRATAAELTYMLIKIETRALFYGRGTNALVAVARGTVPSLERRVALHAAASGEDQTLSAFTAPSGHPPDILPRPCPRLP